MTRDELIAKTQRALDFLTRLGPLIAKRGDQFTFDQSETIKAEYHSTLATLEACSPDITAIDISHVTEWKYVTLDDKTRTTMICDIAVDQSVGLNSMGGKLSIARDYRLYRLFEDPRQAMLFKLSMEVA